MKVEWKVSFWTLVVGMICVFVAFALILWQFAYAFGLASVPGQWVVDVEGLLLWGFFILSFGLVGGFQIGRYVQAKERK